MARKKKKNNNKKLKAVVYAVIVLCSVFLAIGIYYVSLRLTRKDVVINRKTYPICGIDISNHNGDIDFEKVANDTVAFVIIKATEGTNYTDPRFETNYKKARQANLKIGVYHFFRKKRDGRAQADNMVRVVRGKELDLPYVIDVEDWGNDLFVDDSTTVANLRLMVERLQQYGVRVMLYTNKDGHKKYIKKDLRDLNLWICAFDEPDKLVQYDWHLQQYSHWGTVEGIDGDVDLNVFKGNCEQWEHWLQEGSN